MADEQPHRDGCLPLYEKYKVQRTDGRDAPGEKHDGCAYFVLDLTHDPHALPALEAYAEACSKTHGFLSAHLKMAVLRMRDGKPPRKRLLTRRQVVKSHKAMMPDEYYGEEEKGG